MYLIEQKSETMKAKLKIIILIGLTSFALSCSEKNDKNYYLKSVLEKLDKIESATYWSKSEMWYPGDTAATRITNKYVESYKNPLDTIVGTSWANFETENKAHLEFAYDGKMRTLIYDHIKGMVIDSFKINNFPFRPILPPFYNYTENIIKYILETQDSISLEQKEIEDAIFIKLTIHEDTQVEFFGKAYHMPKPPFDFDPISIYELWISKKTNLPYKMRQEMCHSIGVETVSNPKFNKIKIEDFKASDYFPKDYEIRQYGQIGKKRQPNELIGKKAPNWTLITAEKQNISLTDLKSKVLMLQFTSVSCGPCKASIPFLTKLQNEYKESDFDFVAIESTSRNTNVLKNYMKRNQFDYQFLLSNKKILKDYSINSFPVFIILDENRVVKKVLNGYGKGSTDKIIIETINKMIK